MTLFKCIFCNWRTAANSILPLLSVDSQLHISGWHKSNLLSFKGNVFEYDLTFKVSKSFVTYDSLGLGIQVKPFFRLSIIGRVKPNC